MESKNQIKTKTISEEVLLDLFAISKETLAQWKERGLAPNTKGRYDLKALFAWWGENINSSAPDIEKGVKDRYWSAKSKVEGLKVAIIKGELIPLAKVQTLLAEKGLGLKNNLRNLTYRVGGLIEGRKPIEIQLEIENELKRALDGYNRKSWVFEPTEHRRLATLEELEAGRGQGDNE